MKTLSMISILICSIGLVFSTENYSSNLIKAASDKDVCSIMLQQLEKTNKTNLEKAYAGYYHCIWAKHAFNPMAKLSSFKKGRKLLDEAAEKEPKSVEIRLLRYAIQYNSPSFLGYKSSLTKDLEYVKQHKNNIKDKSLRIFLEKQGI
ncbi:MULTISPECIES: hypothetical protein [Sphingobacterium]|uniref:Uncharacterized protein n=1 Tax=Sphingobacterium tenebrionis TaxID=3111775 RepID=A0ABU8I8H8_9SPHI|nr:hypothetical protein [Sphingobacterium sp. 1.A.4]